VVIKDSLDALRYIEEKIIKYVCDEENEPWSQYNDGNEKKFRNVLSQEFKDWIVDEIRSTGIAAKPYWVEQIIMHLRSKAGRSERVNLSLRYKEEMGNFIYDCGDKISLYVDEKKTEFKESDPCFRRYKDQIPLKINENGNIEDINLLDKYLPNFLNEWEINFFKSIIPARMIPGIQQPIDLISGGPGSTKTTFSRLIKAIKDPSIKKETEGDGLPEKEDDLLVTLREQTAVVIDNVHYITKKQQDICCQIVTGTNKRRRKLYTNNESVSSYVQGHLIMNGIQFSNLNADFLDRSLLWELKKMQQEKKKSETKFWEEFELDLPKIRSACIKIIQKAITLKTNCKLSSFRLNDFANWGLACALAIGYSKKDFEKWINMKDESQIESKIENSPIAKPLITFIENHKSGWEGTATELFEELKKQEFGKIEKSWSTNEEKVVIDHRNIPINWPKTVEGFSKELRQIDSFLDIKGDSEGDSKKKRVTVEYKKIRGKRVIKLSRVTVEDSEGDSEGDS